MKPSTTARRNRAPLGDKAIDGRPVVPDRPDLRNRTVAIGHDQALAFLDAAQVHAEVLAELGHAHGVSHVHECSISIAQAIGASDLLGKLHEIAVGIAHVDRPQRTDGPGAIDRALLDRDANVAEVRDHCLDRAVDEQAEIAGAWQRRGGVRLELCPGLMEIDLLVAEAQREPAAAAGGDNEPTWRQLLAAPATVENVKKHIGLDLTLVTTAKTDDEGRELLRLLGMPFRRVESATKAA